MTLNGVSTRHSGPAPDGGRVVSVSLSSHIEWIKKMEKKSNVEVVVHRDIDGKAVILGEGAIWFEGKLLWVDIRRHAVHVYNPATKSNESYSTPSSVGTVVPSSVPGVLIVALRDGFYRLNLADKSVTPIEGALPTKDRPELRFNDGKCDPSGRLWAGAMYINEEAKEAHEGGFLYMMDASLNVRTVLDKISIPNGITWTKDRKTMYYIDSPTCCVLAFDYDDSTGAISNKRKAFDVPSIYGYPDGSTMDADDNLWIAGWAGSCVTKWNPRTKELLKTIPMPTAKITSVAFGGENLTDLYITSASVGQDLSTDKLAGSLFVVRNEGKGVKAVAFQEQVKGKL